MANPADQNAVYHIFRDPYAHEEPGKKFIQEYPIYGRVNYRLMRLEEEWGARCWAERVEKAPQPKALRDAAMRGSLEGHEMADYGGAGC